MINVLLIGGRGIIGSGLRNYLPTLDPNYGIVTVDLPGAVDLAGKQKGESEFVDLDINTDHKAFNSLVSGKDLVIYLARKNPLEEMNAMTDLVFDAVRRQSNPPLIVAASSVHAVDEAYNFIDGPLSILADRKFHEINEMPDPISAITPACPNNDYGQEKAYVEEWAKKMALNGFGAIAARWGGINERNKMTDERGYFTLWCHQEDAARFVHACYTSYVKGTLRNGAHYFVISNNTYNIFDIETPRREIGYEPVHNAEVFYEED